MSTLLPNSLSYRNPPHAVSFKFRLKKSHPCKVFHCQTASYHWSFISAILIIAVPSFSKYMQLSWLA